MSAEPIKQGHFQVPVREAILHCAAIETDQWLNWTPEQVYQEVNGWHKARGFKRGFGYHFLIMPDGFVRRGRPIFVQGAHVAKKNKGTIGILLVESRKIEVPEGRNEIAWLAGNHFSDYYTASQGEALRRTLAGIPGLLRVTGHNDYDKRLCPGFKVVSQDWL